MSTNSKSLNLIINNVLDIKVDIKKKIIYNKKSREIVYSSIAKVGE